MISQCIINHHSSKSIVTPNITQLIFLKMAQPLTPPDSKSYLTAYYTTNETPRQMLELDTLDLRGDRERFYAWSYIIIRDAFCERDWVHMAYNLELMKARYDVPFWCWIALTLIDASARTLHRVQKVSQQYQPVCNRELLPIKIR